MGTLWITTRLQKQRWEKGNCYDLRNFAFLRRKEARRRERRRKRKHLRGTLYMFKKGATFDQKIRFVMSVNERVWLPPPPRNKKQWSNGWHAERLRSHNKEQLLCRITLVKSFFKKLFIVNIQPIFCLSASSCMYIVIRCWSMLPWAKWNNIYSLIVYFMKKGKACTLAHARKFALKISFETFFICIFTQCSVDNANFVEGPRF